ncbi:LacI family DNA-binding transcriptional regulator [Parasalinivibrio latis]|uniref:LacI family DNA-binding transcriptional regulator n=1 Tax=Parasalinivibrio latis TaxID=2952610 RepID=UPI0030E02EAC
MKRFSVKQIAAQAGVSTATVDRVINGREGVHEQTRQRVEKAISELEEQRAQTALRGRTFYLDVVMHTPSRFSYLVRNALTRVAKHLSPYRIRIRFHLFEFIETGELVRVLERIEKHGSHGVILKGADVPEINQSVNRLKQAGVPVVTLVTDLPDSKRIAYIGMDNHAAGKTAAYLLGQWLGGKPAQILVPLSSHQFHGEEARAEGFMEALNAFPNLSAVDASGGLGLELSTQERVRGTLDANPGVRAVYSIGGANRAILKAFEEAGRQCDVFIGHDLDEDNRHLLREQQIHAVIDHNVEEDGKMALLKLLSCYGARLSEDDYKTRINVVTPFNL